MMCKKFLLISFVLVFGLGVVAQGAIVNRYSFTDGDTAAIDSVSGNDGTLEGTATISGNKLVLDGAGAAWLPSDTLDPGLESVTIEVWYTENHDGDIWSRLFDFGGTDASGGGGYAMFCVPHQYGATRFTVATNGFATWQTGEETASGPIFTGQQTHIACVWDGPGAEIKIYANGVLQEAVATTMDLSAILRENAYIGDSCYTGDAYMIGTVDEFRIYNAALTDAEVLDSFNAGPDAEISAEPYVEPELGPLKVDFGRPDPNHVEDGYQAYVADHEVLETFTSQSFSAFGTTVTVTPTWAVGTNNEAMQMIERTGDGRHIATTDLTNLTRDWIGTDTRDPKGLEDPLTLTISGLPAGTYSWLSYHHDTVDQTGIFNVTVTDALGSFTTDEIDISHNDVTDIAAITKFATTIVSDGNDVTLVFDLTSGPEPISDTFFVMNGFEINSLDGLPVDPGTDNLVAHYALENDANDSSANELHGTLEVMGGGNDAMFVAGAAGMAIDLLPTDVGTVGPYVNCGADPLFDMNEAITVGAWANIRSIPDEWRAIICKGDSAWRIATQGPATSFQFAYAGYGVRPDNIFSADGVTEVEFDEWHYVCGTYDITDGARLYVDGVLDAMTPDTLGIAVNTFDVTIGANLEDTGWKPYRLFDGMIDEVRIYDRALSADEVAALAGL